MTPLERWSLHLAALATAGPGLTGGAAAGLPTAGGGAGCGPAAAPFFFASGGAAAAISLGSQST